MTIKLSRGGDLPAVAVSRSILLTRLSDSWARFAALSSPQVLCEQSSTEVLNAFHHFNDLADAVIEPGVLPVWIETSLVRERQ